MERQVCASCWAPGHDALPSRANAGVSGVVVHRIEVSQEDPLFLDTPAEVARFFREHPVGQRATGGSMPYPLLVDAAGTVTQTVPLWRVTPHARTYNATTVGVGVIGDFRARPTTPPQYAALVLVCASVLAELGLSADGLHGHDELSGGSADPNKECPGRHLPMARLREDVLAAMSGRPCSFAFVW